MGGIHDWYNVSRVVQPIADKVAQNLEIVSKNFRFSTRHTRILTGLVIYYLVLIVNPMGRILVRWKGFKNNLEIQCHPICDRLYLSIIPLAALTQPSPDMWTSTGAASDNDIWMIYQWCMNNIWMLYDTSIYEWTIAYPLIRFALLPASLWCGVSWKCLRDEWWWVNALSVWTGKVHDEWSVSRTIYQLDVVSHVLSINDESSVSCAIYQLDVVYHVLSIN